MNLVTLGQTDLRVTPICLGTMTFGEQVDEATTHAILDHALARGVNFIDTAEMYSGPGARRDLRRDRDADRPLVRRAPRRCAKGRARDQGRRPVARHAVDSRRQPRSARRRHRAGLRRQPAPTADRRHRPLPDPLAEPQCADVRPDLFRPEARRRNSAGAGAARGARNARQGGQGAPHRAVQRDRLRPRRVRARGASLRPPARGDGAEPLLPDQSHARERAGRGDVPPRRVVARLFAARLRPAHRQVRRARVRRPRPAGSHEPVRQHEGSSAGAAPSRSPPHGATTRSRASTA